MNQKIDWVSIEKEYRLGQKSMRTLAFQFNISPSTVSRRAKKYFWVQDRALEVRERTLELLEHRECTTPTDKDIEVAAATNRQVIFNHRRSLGNALSLFSMLVAELKAVFDNQTEIESDIIDFANGNSKIGRRRHNRMLRAVSLPAYARILRDLSVALKNLIPLERQAYSLDSSSGDDDAPDSIHITYYKNPDFDVDIAKLTNRDQQK